jgi:hypothetical protein
MVKHTGQMAEEGGWSDPLGSEHPTTRLGRLAIADTISKILGNH